MNIVKRLITSWAAAAAVLVIALFGAGGSITLDKTVGADFSAILFCMIVLVFFMLISAAVIAVKNKETALRIDNLALFLSVFVLELRLCLRAENIFTVLSALVPLAIVSFYVFMHETDPLGKIKLTLRAGIIAAALCGVFIAGFISWYTCLRYLTFGSPNYDFGLFCNMFASMARDFTQTVSCERDEIISHFAVHFSPIYYLMLPFYFVFRSPLTLQILQGVIIGSGALPLYFICRRRKLSPRAGAAVAAVYALFPALSGGCAYDLHENCFLAPLLLWLFWSFERRDRLGNILVFVFTALTLCVKEDAAVYVAFAGIYMMFASPEVTPDIGDKKPNRRKIRSVLRYFFNTGRSLGLLIILISIAWFGFTSWFLTKYGYGIMSYRYSNFIADGDSLLGMIVTIIRNPALVFTEALTVEKLTFLAQMILPLALIPFVTKKPHRLLLLLPMLLINLMTDYKYQYNILFQYVFGSSAFLFYACALNLSEMTAKLRHALLALALGSSILFFGAFMTPLGRYQSTYSSGYSSYVKMEQALDTIPDDASVTASTRLIAHIADRREIYELDKKETQATTDYVAFDMRSVGSGDRQKYIDHYESAGYEITEEENSLILILGRKD